MNPRRLQEPALTPLNPAHEAEAESPETRPDLLYLRTQTAPDAVLRNPLLPLLWLENPSRAELLWRKARYFSWVHELRARVCALAFHEARLLACDCAARTTEFYQNRFPGDERVLEALRVARRFAAGLASPDELGGARNRAFRASEQAGRSLSIRESAEVRSSQFAARAVFHACLRSPDPLQAAMFAMAARRVRPGGEKMSWVYSSGGHSADGDARAEGEEAEWQRARLAHYLHQPIS